jgi:4'-phosphopantetheinyl transferase
VVCAVALTVVGIDLEPEEHARSILRVTPRIFSPRELIDLDDLTDEARRDRALTLWTLKESYAKARGMGLSLPFRAFSFTLNDLEKIGLTFDSSMDDDADRWHFRLVTYAAHRIALAAERSGETTPRLRAFETAPLTREKELAIQWYSGAAGLIH